MDEDKKNLDAAQEPAPQTGPVINDMTPPPVAKAVTDAEQEPTQQQIIVKTDPEATQSDEKNTQDQEVLVAESGTEEDDGGLAVPPTEKDEDQPKEPEAQQAEVAPVQKEPANPAQALETENIPTPSEPEAQTSKSGVVDDTPAVVGVSSSQMAKAHNPHRNNKKLAVAITLVVAALLAGTAVFVYLTTDSNTQETSNVAPAPQPEAVEQQNAADELPVDTTPPAAIEDTDEVADEIDQTTNELEGNSDLDEADLSNPDPDTNSDLDSGSELQ